MSRTSSPPCEVEDIAALLPPPYRARLTRIEFLTSLWAGYGGIYRLHFEGSEDAEASSEVPPSAILKWIRPPSKSFKYDEDEDEQEGTMRKLLSYRVEANFYSALASLYSSDHHATPRFLARPTPFILLMSDLSLTHDLMPTGRRNLTLQQALSGIDALAQFHACYWAYEAKIERECPEPLEEIRRLSNGDRVGWQGDGVWKWGTYNYLQTRLPGLRLIDDASSFRIFKTDPDLAWAIEDALQNPDGRRGLTLVHGDAKAENMAFRKVEVSQGDGDMGSLVQAHAVDGMAVPVAFDFPASWLSMSQVYQVAFYDFQYVGVGLPTQDLIKYLCCVVPPRYLRSQSDEVAWLSFYHYRLSHHLKSYANTRKGPLPEALPAAEYPFQQFKEDFDLSLLSWVRFTEGWGGGAWGNVDWLHHRAQSILFGKEGVQWLESIKRRWVQKKGE